MSRKSLRFALSGKWWIAKVDTIARGDWANFLQSGLPRSNRPILIRVF